MAKIIPIMVLSLGLCAACAQTREEKMLDSLTQHFLTDREDAIALHQNLDFLGLPSNVDIERLTFDEPIRLYLVKTDSSLVQSGKFKVKTVSRPTDCWKLPFRYEGRYIATLEIDKVDGKFMLAELKQGDAARWDDAEKRVAKGKRKGTRMLAYGPRSYLHFPEIDEYNLLPMNNFDEKDTASAAALNSPLKINTDLVRKRLKDEVIKGHRAEKSGSMK